MKEANKVIKEVPYNKVLGVEGVPTRLGVILNNIKIIDVIGVSLLLSVGIILIIRLGG